MADVQMDVKALLPYALVEENEVKNEKCLPINYGSPKRGIRWIEQFFTPLYYIKNDAPFSILLHTNRVCLVGLAPSHCAFSKGITQISYLINVKTELNVKNRNSTLQENTPIAIVTCKDDSTFKIPCCVKGKLIGYNQYALKDPSVLAQKGYGYVAVILLKLEEEEKVKTNLLSHSDYLTKFVHCDSSQIDT